MKKSIWKFNIESDNSKGIEMPKNAEILTVQEQGGNISLWALVDPKEEKELRYFEVYGTGHDIHYGMGVSREYVGTFQFDGGTLVFHLFENTGV